MAIGSKCFSPSSFQTASYHLAIQGELDVLRVGDLLNADHLQDVNGYIDCCISWRGRLLVVRCEVKHLTSYFVAVVTAVDHLIASFLHWNTEAVIADELDILAGPDLQLGGVHCTVHVAILVPANTPIMYAHCIGGFWGAGDACCV